MSFTPTITPDFLYSQIADRIDKQIEQNILKSGYKLLSSSSASPLTGRKNNRYFNN